MPQVDVVFQRPSNPRVGRVHFESNSKQSISERTPRGYHETDNR
jgi:hypothetical protein